MRIVIDGSLPMSPASGTFRYVAELVKAFNESGDDEIMLLTAPDTGAVLRSYVGEANRVTFVDTGSRGKLRERLAATKAAVSSIRPAVLHSPGYFVPSGTRTKIVVSVHDVNFLVRFPDWARGGDALRAGRLAVHVGGLVAKANAVIVPSHRTRRELCRLVPFLSSRTHVVPYSASLPPARRAAFSERLPRLISVGVLAPQKNLATSIRAFARALPALPADAEYRLVGRQGGSHWHDELAPLVRSLGLERRVHWLGEVKDAELEGEYDKARALSLMSRGEGYGLPAVEALARGLPVIGSSTTALVESTGGGAILVDPEDVGAIAEHMSMLLNNERYWNAHSEVGALHARLRTWTRVAIAHQAVYEAAAAR